MKTYHRKRQSPYGQSGEWLGEYLVDYARRTYAPQKVTHRAGPFDKDGVPLFDIRAFYLSGDPVYHPINIIQYALAHYHLWLDGVSESHDKYMTCARWLEENAVPYAGGRFLAWPYPFPLKWYGVPPGWISGMAQCQAVSVLARAYQSSGSEKTEQVLHGAINCLRYDTNEGGVIARMPDRGPFIEEVCHYPYLHILNGFLYSIFGLYEYLQLFRDEELAELLSACVTCVERSLPDYDTGWWSRYSTGMRWHLAKPSYHWTHVHQLRGLAGLFGNSVFNEYADRWERYAEKALNRRRLTVTKFLHSCINYACTRLRLEAVKNSNLAKIGC